MTCCRLARQGRRYWAQHLYVKEKRRRQEAGLDGGVVELLL